MTSDSLDLDLIRLQCETKDFSEVACPGCQDRLVVHQPDERLTDRLLGICCSCPAWFVIDAAAEIMIRLPGMDALAARQSDGSVPPRTADPVRSGASARWRRSPR